MNPSQGECNKPQEVKINISRISLNTNQSHQSIKANFERWKKEKEKTKFYQERSPRKQKHFDSSLYWIKQILQKDQKNEEDELSLYEHFNHYKFFNDFIETTCVEDRIRVITYLSKKLEYERYEAGSIIMKQGEKSNKRIYIVLSGRLQMRLQNKSFSKKEEESNKIGDQLKVPAVVKHKVVHKIVQKFSFSFSSRQSSFSPENSMNQPNPEDQLKVHIRTPGSKSNFRGKSDLKRSHHEDSIGPESQAAQIVKLNQTSESETKMTSLYGKVVSEFKEMDHFGEQALVCLSKRPGTVIAVSDVELVSFDQTQFRNVHKEVNESKKMITHLLTAILPGLEKPENKKCLETLLSIAEINDYLHGRKLTVEGSQGDEFFLIIQGQCEIMKTVVYDKSGQLKAVNSLYGLTKTTKENMVIANVENGSLIGDEILFNGRGMYEYTVTITSETAQFVKFKKNVFLFRAQQAILEELESYSNKKNLRNAESLREKLDKKGIQTNVQTLKAIRPIVNLPETLSNYNSNTHEFVKTPLKVRYQLKLDVLNILLPKPSNQTTRQKLNNYLEGDGKELPLTSRPQTTFNLKERSTPKAMSGKREYSLTPKIKPRVKNIVEVPSYSNILSGISTPTKVTSPKRKRRSVSSFAKNLQQQLSEIRRKINRDNDTESLTHEPLPFRDRLQKKVSVPKIDLKEIDTKKENLKSLIFHKETSPMEKKSKSQTSLLDFLTVRLIKSKATAQTPHIRSPPEPILIEDSPLLEIQSLSSREGNRDFRNKIALKSRNQSSQKPSSLTEKGFNLTNEFQSLREIQRKRASSQTSPKGVYTNKSDKDFNSTFSQRVELKMVQDISER